MTRRSVRAQIAGLLLYLGYKLQHHYFFRVSLRNWLWVLLVAAPSAALLRRLAWVYAILLSLLAALLLAGIEWTRQRGYITFEPTQLDLDTETLPSIGIDEQVPCRASGSFAVSDRQRYMVNETAWISYVRTREHIVMVHLEQTRFLLLTRSLATDVGYWYVFFFPQDVKSIEMGNVVCGIRSRPGLAIRYQPPEKREEHEIYLAFDDTSGLQRVLDDLRVDGAPDQVSRCRTSQSSRSSSMS